MKIDTITAYAAGLIDGEGSICLGQKEKYTFRTPVVSIASTTYELVSFMKDNFGGCISTKKTKQKSTHKTSYIWSISNNTALNFLNKIVTYLREPKKKHRARYILSRYKAVTVRNGKYSSFQRERKMEFEKVFFLI